MGGRAPARADVCQEVREELRGEILTGMNTRTGEAISSRLLLRACLPDGLLCCIGSCNSVAIASMRLQERPHSVGTVGSRLQGLESGSKRSASQTGSYLCRFSGPKTLARDPLQPGSGRRLRCPCVHRPLEQAHRRVAGFIVVLVMAGDPCQGHLVPETLATVTNSPGRLRALRCLLR